MIPAAQREALAVLTEMCELSPDVRLGQLLAHLGFLGEDQTGRTLWDIDDEQLLAVIYHHRAELASRQLLNQTLQPSVGAGSAIPESSATFGAPAGELGRSAASGSP